jgi:hypothetical protein
MLDMMGIEIEEKKGGQRVEYKKIDPVILP